MSGLVRKLTIKNLLNKEENDCTVGNLLETDRPFSEDLFEKVDINRYFGVAIEDSTKMVSHITIFDDNDQFFSYKLVQI